MAKKILIFSMTKEFTAVSQNKGKNLIKYSSGDQMDPSLEGFPIFL